MRQMILTQIDRKGTFLKSAGEEWAHCRGVTETKQTMHKQVRAPFRDGLGYTRYDGEGCVRVLYIRLGHWSKSTR